GCAGSAPGGTWTSYGGGLDNARDQRAETTIGAANAGSLAPVWDLKTADGGTFQTTPVIADGCMFIGSSTGKVYARNADTGKPLWTTDLVTAPQYTGSDIIGAPLVANGRVYVDSTIDGAPDLVAIDEATGAIA